MYGFKSMENYFCDLLAVQDLLTINEFLDMLGFDRREDGFDMVFHKGDSISVTLDDSTGVVHFVLNN